MPTPPKKPQSGSGCLYVLLAVFGLLIALGVLSFSSSISGTEFSPNTFQTRSFAYARIPGTRIRVAPTSLGASIATVSIDVLKHLPNSNRTQEWHVTSIMGESNVTHGASVLVEALKQRTSDGQDVWGAWSIRHPKSASFFWPLVQQVAFQQLYECIPELLQVAEAEDDPVSLEREALAVVVQTVKERIKRSTEEAQTTELLAWLSGIPVMDTSNSQFLNEAKEDLLKTYRDIAP